jgi:hypothetical protein
MFNLHFTEETCARAFHTSEFMYILDDHARFDAPPASRSDTRTVCILIYAAVLCNAFRLLTFCLIGHRNSNKPVARPLG